MKHILNDIFTLYIQKRENQPLSEIEKAEKEKEIESYQKLYKTLSDNQKKLFDPFIDLVDNLNDNKEERAYKNGFIAGALLMIEIFTAN